MKNGCAIGVKSDHHFFLDFSFSSFLLINKTTQRNEWGPYEFQYHKNFIKNSFNVIYVCYFFVSARGSK